MTSRHRRPSPSPRFRTMLVCLWPRCHTLGSGHTSCGSRWRDGGGGNWPDVFNPWPRLLARCPLQPRAQMHNLKRRRSRVTGRNDHQEPNYRSKRSRKSSFWAICDLGWKATFRFAWLVDLFCKRSSIYVTFYSNIHQKVNSYCLKTRGVAPNCGLWVQIWWTPPPQHQAPHTCFFLFHFKFLSANQLVLFDRLIFFSWQPYYTLQYKWIFIN